MSKEFLTPLDLAKRWTIDTCTLKQWRWYGKGPDYHKIGGRIKYYLEDIVLFEKAAVRQHTSTPGPEVHAPHR